MIRTTAPTEPRYLNRELSWLSFNARVLAQAENESLPLLERAKFLAIFSTNLDEFFQVRVAGLKEQLVSGSGGTSLDGMTPAEQLRRIREVVVELSGRASNAFLKQLAPELEAHGVRFADWSSLDADDVGHLNRIFEEQVFPVLTPLAVDPAHPFPYISNLSLNLAVVLRAPGEDDPRFARVKVPRLLSRFMMLPDGERFVPLEQVIAAHLDRLFAGMEVVEHHPFRVTRNAGLEVGEEEAPDLLEAIEDELLRRRFGRVVRLEVTSAMPDGIRDLLVRELGVAADDVYVLDGPLDLGGLWALHELDRPDLAEEPSLPVTPARFAPVNTNRDVFATLDHGDVLVHHPYESFTASVEAFVDAAADDPHVLAIKQTLYRTSGDSPIVGALIRAAESGKQVAVLVELKARFDEAANIGWARQLERVGVHVAYGLVGLKTHAKTALVVRQEGGRLRRYAHIGTGNYNAQTARVYEDLGLLTADRDLGADLTELFNALTGYSHQRAYRKLLVAPGQLRERIIDLVRQQAERADGRIVMKLNNLVDARTIDALYDASRAGAEIDLVVRGICCLRPGVPGLSENIRVRSLVGRYLEHSRVLRFGRGDDASWFLGSADLMPRNLDGRVEAVTPVEDPAARDRLDEILDACLDDDVLAWDLQADGSWTKVATEEGVNAQALLYARALARNHVESP